MSLSTITHKSALSLIRNFIPPLSNAFHKGQAGRVAVVGGCEDYTGAPYFSALASTLLGADMSHVICEKSAATALKSYSPNLMVHPYLFDSTSEKQYASYGVPTDEEAVMSKVLAVIDRVHVVVVGPGLGRDAVLLKTIKRIIEEVKKRSMPLVIDADGLYLVQQHPEVIKGYNKVILTPNVVEFQRLKDSIGFKPKESSTHEENLQKLCELLGGVSILEKGKSDYISNESTTLENPLPGGLKRVSGQGDTLTGTLATFLAWQKAFQTPDVWDHPKSIEFEGQKLTERDLYLLAAFGASAVTRYASYLAFKNHGRALLTSQISDYIGQSYRTLFESDIDSNPELKNYFDGDANQLSKV